MYFGTFHECFPNFGDKQIRTLTVFDESNPALPKGEYGFVTFYCRDKKCDCRRVLICVLQPDLPLDQPLAKLSYGWEPPAFYKKKFPSLPPDMLVSFKGPALDYAQKPTPIANELLQAFIFMLKDQKYAQRFKFQYARFKWKMGMKIPTDMQPYVGLMSDCPCGSGEKFKNCCGGKK